MGERPPPQGQWAGALGPPPLPSAAATESLSSSLLSPWPQAFSLADAEVVAGNEMELLNHRPNGRRDGPHVTSISICHHPIVRDFHLNSQKNAAVSPAT